MSESDGSARLGRRLLVLRVAGLGAASAAVSVTAACAVEQVRTDNDPNDAAGYGRGGGYRGYTGRTDNDPSDGQGQGRGRGYAPPPQARGVTDNDPSDGQGRGRGYGYAP